MNHFLQDFFSPQDDTLTFTLLRVLFPPLLLLLALHVCAYSAWPLAAFSPRQQPPPSSHHHHQPSLGRRPCSSWQSKPISTHSRNHLSQITWSCLRTMHFFFFESTPLDAESPKLNCWVLRCKLHEKEIMPCSRTHRHAAGNSYCEGVKMGSKRIACALQRGLSVVSTHPLNFTHGNAFPYRSLSAACITWKPCSLRYRYYKVSNNTVHKHLHACGYAA